jgi:hypothetical protein
MPGASQITLTSMARRSAPSRRRLPRRRRRRQRRWPVTRRFHHRQPHRPVTGTKIIGKVVDPGPDLEPMTFDDIRRGADGVIHTADDVFLPHRRGQGCGSWARRTARLHRRRRQLRAHWTCRPARSRWPSTAAPPPMRPPDVFWPEMVMDADLRPGHQHGDGQHGHAARAGAPTPTAARSICRACRPACCRT